MEAIIKRLRDFLETDFERELFAASVAYIEKTDDPLRFNSFCASIRELSRHIFERLAPDAEVKECTWFTPESSNGSPTRKQRILYAIKGGLSETFVEEELFIDFTDEIKEIIDNINLLSKFTHVSEKTFNIPQEKCLSLSEDVLSSLLSIFQSVEQLRSEVKSSLHNYIDDALQDVFVLEVFSELDILSSQTIPDMSELESFEITNITSKKIIITGDGYINVSLNYGKGEDYTELHDSFPYIFKCYSEVTNPKKIVINRHEVEVDTSSWYQ